MPASGVNEFEVGTHGPFRWSRVVASTSLRCAHCGAVQRIEVSALVDWRDRSAAQKQRRQADGVPCSSCERLNEIPVPLLQYRRGDVVGLIVGFPAGSEAERDKQFIADVLAVASGLDLVGLDVVVSVRMAWWGAVYKAALGPALVADRPLVLPESAEETERWLIAVRASLNLPDVDAALRDFVAADDYQSAREVVGRVPELADANWAVSIDALGVVLGEQLESDEARSLLHYRLGRLGQLRLLGPDGASEVAVTSDLAGLIDDATNAVGSERTSKLHDVGAALDRAPESALSAAALTTLVAAMMSDPSRAQAGHSKLRAIAERAVDVSARIAGPDTLLHHQAVLNLAVVIDEDDNEDNGPGVSLEVLSEIAPTAARLGSPIVADIATNLATLASRSGARADRPEQAAELLDDASYVASILEQNPKRSEVVHLVDRAAILRSRIVGDRAENAEAAVELLREALARNSEWGLLSPAESVLLAGNLANAVHQLHERRPTASSARERIEVVEAAVEAIRKLNRSHPVGIEVLNNAGSIMADAYSETVLSGAPDLALWNGARDLLEDANERAADAFPSHHVLSLRIAANLATVYGRPINGQVADRPRAAELLRYVIEHSPAGHEEYVVTAATNLAQLAMGQGDWADAAESYEVAQVATAQLIERARTSLTKLGEVMISSDVAVRRALALTGDGDFEAAVGVIEANRTRLTGRAVATDAGLGGGTTVHVATCDYGTLGIITFPTGDTTGFRTPLTAGEVKRLTHDLLTSSGGARADALEALHLVLRSTVTGPVEVILDVAEPFQDLRVIAAGALTGCPLSTVPDRDGHCWNDRWSVHHLVTSAAEAPSAISTEGRVIALVDPDQTLTFARSELEAVQRFAPRATIFPGGRSPELWLLDNLETATVAHIAAHATLDVGDPTRSAFDLGSGTRLSVADLDGRFFPELELVVAPACQSASAYPDAPDELLGVAHALLHAGANGVVAALWDADDDATALIVARFYEALASGVPPGVALSTAQRYARYVDAGTLIEIARRRLSDADAKDAHWMPRDLAVEFAARAAHPRLGAPNARWFAHPAQWSALSYIRA